MAQRPSGELAGDSATGEFAGDLVGDVRARVRAAGPPSLSATAPSPTGVPGSGLVVAALLLLELGRTGLVGKAASSGGSTQGA